MRNSTVEDNLIVFYAVAAFCALFIGLAKGGLGGTIAGLATPIMALVLPVGEVLGLVLPMFMIADVFSLGAYWKHWRWRLVLLMLPGGVVGVTVGTLFITNAPTRGLRIALGVISLLVALYKLVEKRLAAVLTYQPRSWHGVLAGAVAGFSSSLAHNGAPPASIYLLLQKDLAPRAFVATMLMYFFILNWIKVPYYLYAGLFDVQRMLQVVWVIPLLPLGVWIGEKLVERVNRDAFDLIMAGALALLGVVLIFT
jgi:hypothetical protein